MALSVAQIYSDAKYYLDDSSLTTSETVRPVNLGRMEIAKEANAFPSTLTTSSSTTTNAYALADTVYKVTNIVMNVDNDRARVLPIKQDDWDRLDFGQTGDRYNYYYEDGRTLMFYPPLTESANTGTLSTAINTGATTIYLNSLGDLPTEGRG